MHYSRGGGVQTGLLTNMYKQFTLQDTPTIGHGYTYNLTIIFVSVE